MSKKPTILSIAGFDGSCGAGVVADVNTARVLGAHGVAVLTCVTAQNTTGIKEVFPLPEKLIRDQIESLFEDFDISAVKIGVLYSKSAALAVVGTLEKFKPKFVVLDPVISSSSGTRLACKETINFLCKKVFPMCSLVTPNFLELCMLLRLLGKDKFANDLENSKSRKHFEDLYMAVSAFFLDLDFPPFFVKGGHLPLSIISKLTNEKLVHFDALLFDGSVDILEQNRIKTNNSHGTGCTLSTAISVELCRNKTLRDAVKTAQEFVFRSILLAREVKFGNGSGPIDQFVPDYLFKYHLKGKL
ncbi:hydroxymethylpyrimidine/phosphomethylpyrimidine kinase [Betaproteobacteria bacterium]|nr:hydroxymethylpyrimidine/phosphomethylpyrimidine kinase [Betaproteobacteria bacterium]